MENIHNPKEVLAYLKDNHVGTLGTYDTKLKHIRMRIMYYGVDKKFNLYLMSSKNSPKINQMLLFPYVSFMVYGITEPYDNSWQIEIEGKIIILDQLKEKGYLFV